MSLQWCYSPRTCHPWHDLDSTSDTEIPQAGGVVVMRDTTGNIAVSLTGWHCHTALQLARKPISKISSQKESQLWDKPHLSFLLPGGGILKSLWRNSLFLTFLTWKHYALGDSACLGGFPSPESLEVFIFVVLKWHCTLYTQKSNSFNRNRTWSILCLSCRICVFPAHTSAPPSVPLQSCQKCYFCFKPRTFKVMVKALNSNLFHSF